MKTSLIKFLSFLALSLLMTACSNKVPDCDSDAAVDRLIEKIHSDHISPDNLQGVIAIGGKQFARYIKDLPQKVRHDDFSVRAIELLSLDKDTERTFCRAQLTLSPDPKLAQKFLDFYQDLKAGSKSENGIGNISRACEGIQFVTLLNPNFKFGGGIESLTKTTLVDYQMSKNLSEGDFLFTYDADTSPLALPIYVAMMSRCYDERFGEYEGDLVDGVRHGDGKVSFPSGVTYAGQFKDGKADGKGTLTYADGSIYVGDMSRNKLEGKGSRTYKDGKKYVGEFKKDKRHGNGVLYGENGDILKQGTWSNDRFMTGSDSKADALAPKASQQQHQESDLPRGNRSLRETESRKTTEAKVRGGSQQSERSELKRGTRTLE